MAATTTASALWFKNTFAFLKEVFSDFIDDKVLKYSAALSYYTVFAIAPFLTIIISVTSMVFGKNANVQEKLFAQINGLLGSEAAKQIQEMITNTQRSGNSWIASVISVIVLIVVATGIFAEIQDSINSIWGLKSKPSAGILKMLLNRLISFSLIVSLGFVLMVSLALNAIVDAISGQLANIVPGAGVYLLSIINLALTFVVVSFLFAVIFKVLPDAKIKWRDVMKGAFLTAILFIIGRYLIGLYVAKSNLSCLYGAAGSIAVILVWVYYTAIILYFGAEFTKVYSIKYGSKILPNDYAVFVKVKEEELPRQASLLEAKKDEHPRGDSN